MLATDKRKDGQMDIDIDKIPAIMEGAWWQTDRQTDGQWQQAHTDKEWEMWVNQLIIHCVSMTNWLIYTTVAVAGAIVRPASELN